MVPVLCFSSSNFHDSLGTLPPCSSSSSFRLPAPTPPPIFCLPVPHPAALTLAPASLFDSNGTANKMNGALDHSDQPDPDAIKMFVGQIPRSWSEKELKELFEPYGAVYQINVLRDRSQNPPQSKGTDRGAHAVGGGCARWAGWGWGRGSCASPGFLGIGNHGREEGEGEPPSAPVPRGQPGSSLRPRPPPGQVDQLAWDVGKEGRRDRAGGGGAGAAGLLSRRVIPPGGHFPGSAGSSGRGGSPPPGGIVFLRLACQELFLRRPFRYCPCAYNCISLFRGLWGF